MAMRYGNVISLPFRFSPIIDNEHIGNGIPFVFAECYSKFIELDQAINLKFVVKSLASMLDMKFLEHKIAILIMTYEYFLSKYLVYLGEPIEKVEGCNIQQKLCRLNGRLRFIPKRLLKDSLRDDVRNPLFHGGVIPSLKDKDMWNFYSEYNDLLVQIILRLLEYTGSYISPNGFGVQESIGSVSVDG